MAAPKVNFGSSNLNLEEQGRNPKKEAEEAELERAIQERAAMSKAQEGSLSGWLDRKFGISNVNNNRSYLNGGRHKRRTSRNRNKSKRKSRVNRKRLNK